MKGQPEKPNVMTLSLMETVVLIRRLNFIVSVGTEIMLSTEYSFKYFCRMKCLK